MSGPDAPPPRQAGAGTTTRSLAGDLPCVRCGYNLRGLSVVGVCPECATPVRATILAAVDPYANLLMPIPMRRFTAIGLVLWAAGALGAALVTWAIRARDALDLMAGASLDSAWAVTAGMACILISGLGALALIRPHAGIPRAQIAAAIAGCVAYVPLLWVYWRVHGVIDAAAPAPFLTEYADPQRSVLRLIAGGLFLVILLGLRPNARLLAARSLLLREGRVDRQTMRAMSVVVAVGVLGDLMHLAGRSLPGDWPIYATTAGTAVIAVSFMLLTIGLGGIMLDVWRIWPVVLEPAPGYRQVLGPTPNRAANPLPAGTGDAARA